MAVGAVHCRTLVRTSAIDPCGNLCSIHTFSRPVTIIERQSVCMRARAHEGERRGGELVVGSVVRPRTSKAPRIGCEARVDEKRVRARSRER